MTGGVRDARYDASLSEPIIITLYNYNIIYGYNVCASLLDGGCVRYRTYWYWLSKAVKEAACKLRVILCM